MSGHGLPGAPHGEMAPDIESFAFTEANLEHAKVVLAKYPEPRRASAILPLLHVAQAQHGGWLPRAALDYLADFLGMPKIRVYEVASFYDMYNTEPVGRIQVRVCTTTPCWLCGSDDIVRACKDELGCDIGESSADGKFFLREFECLGACANAPVLWIDDEFYEDLSYDDARAIVQALKRGEQPKPGSKKRKASMPEGGKTTLLEPVKPWKRSLDETPKDEAAGEGKGS
ncbi:NADH dehydrogenase subunit E [Arboricoccus pini]|uniref:NADH dehydrogenase subunit E n=1 Tax=Arboricoccus pini TaxID=1963835 RepID=A0A212PWG2_9PROT|nr:NADH-quinone oxidoreductase subunit NuoE [Arboricoccus pini]SNB51230.1 NADH dehydrogenase subunit E [Arboricoccus pini]